VPARELDYGGLVGEIRQRVGRRVHVQMRTAVAGDWLSVRRELRNPLVFADQAVSFQVGAAAELAVHFTSPDGDDQVEWASVADNGDVQGRRGPASR
jgi:hypothetical protein